MTATFVDLRTIPLANLRKFPGNAKKGDVDAIRASLRETSQYRSLIVRDEGDGVLTVLAGNNTLEAMRREGWSDARCEVITCDPITATQINLKDNKLAELGTMDEKSLALLLDSLGDAATVGTGYNDDDINAILASSDLYGERAGAFLDDFDGSPGSTGDQAKPSSAPESDGDAEGEGDDAPAPSDAESESQTSPAPAPGEAYVPLTYSATIPQRDLIRSAIRVAQSRDGLATSVEGLAAVCAAYLEANGMSA